MKYCQPTVLRSPCSPALPTRRRFLLECSALLAATSLAPVAGLAADAPWRDVTLDQLSLPALRAKVGETFTVRDSAGASQALVLVEAPTQAPSRHARATDPDAAHEKFSLVFRGPRAPALGQETYVFEHAGLGRFALFIVPVPRSDPKFCYYQAIFNRPVPGAAAQNHSAARTAAPASASNR